MNPYEVLGVPEGADEETIKRAYKQLVKKYHPDKYVNNPLADLASEKLKEINKAYDMLMNKGGTGSSGGGWSGGAYSGAGHRGGAYTGSTQNGANASFQAVRMMISAGNVVGAEQMLQRLPHTAEWNYLMGVCRLRRGWATEGLNYIRTACQMEPGNLEYQNTLNSVQNANGGYRNVNTAGGWGSDPCSCCSTMILADCCCESCGGDLIPCC